MEFPLPSRQPTVLVTGDIVCNTHLVGTLDRLRAEDAAPTFSATSRYYALGGAADAATNLRALGCDVRLVSVVGTDAAGRRTRELLRQQSIADTLVLEDVGRPTAQRTYLLSADKEVLCLDRPCGVPLSNALVQRLLECVGDVLANVDAIVCADGEPGFWSSDLLARLCAAAAAAGCPVFFGAGGRQWTRCRPSDAVLPVDAAEPRANSPRTDCDCSTASLDAIVQEITLRSRPAGAAV